MPESNPDGIRIDVSRLVQRSIASLHAHLVTRPTGRAVRLAIETQLAEVADPAVSLVDLSDVSILDFSCADEVVAKLVQRYLSDDRPRNAFFVFRGVQERHREPIEIVLHRQSLATVTQSEDGAFELVGAVSEPEAEAWAHLDRVGRVAGIDGAGAGASVREGLGLLRSRRLVFEDPEGGLHALSRLVRALEP
jgi:hypothetical protein